MRIDSLLEDAHAYAAVTDATEYQLVVDNSSKIKQAIKDVQAITVPFKDIFFKMHRASTGEENRILNDLLAAADRQTGPRGIATIWYLAEERRKAEESAALQRQETARLAAIQQEKDALALAEAEKLAKAGQMAAAELVLDKREQEAAVEALTPPPQVIPPPPPATNMSVKKVWKCRVIDKMAFIKAAIGAQFLETYLLIDEAGLNRLAAAQGANFQVPGLEAYQEVQTATRSGGRYC